MKTIIIKQAVFSTTVFFVNQTYFLIFTLFNRFQSIQKISIIHLTFNKKKLNILFAK